MSLLSEHLFSAGGLTVRHHQLDNGLGVILLRDPAAPVFAYQTWFRVGSRDEREGKTGIAHLFEHLMFKASKNFPKGQFDRLIETQGGGTNAATWVDWTFYQDDLPAADLELAVRLEADRMVHLDLSAEQVEPEREVVMNERLMSVEDSVDGFLGEKLFRLAFEAHSYRWPTIGWMRDIKGITLDDANAFYRTYYAPNNATVVVVGDFDEAQTLDLINRHYGGIAAQTLPVAARETEPEQTGERRAIYKRQVVTDRLLIGYKSPSFLAPEHLHLQVLSDILFGGPSSVLYRDLVVEREMASSIGGMVMPFADPGLFEISAFARSGHKAQDIEPVVYEHIQRLQDNPPSAAQVERAQARFLTHFYTELRTARGKAESLGNYHTTCGDYRRLFGVAAAIKAVTAEDVQKVAQQFLREDCRTVIIGTPMGPVSFQEAEAEEAAELAQVAQEEGGGALGPVHRGSGNGGAR